MFLSRRFLHPPLLVSISVASPSQTDIESMSVPGNSVRSTQFRTPFEPSLTESSEARFAAAIAAIFTT